MVDLKLKELVDEVNRCSANYNYASNETVSIATYELMVAEERLNLYLKEKKSLSAPQQNRS